MVDKVVFGADTLADDGSVDTTLGAENVIDPEPALERLKRYLDDDDVIARVATTGQTGQYTGGRSHPVADLRE